MVLKEFQSLGLGLEIKVLVLVLKTSLDYISASGTIIANSDVASDLSRPPRGGGVITTPPPVFMRHPQPSEVQRGF